MLDDISYSYLTIADIDTPQYRVFLEAYHGAGTFPAWRERITWYFSKGNDAYRILVAKTDSKYVGQSCAYKVTAIVNGVETVWWWSIDTFVFPQMRGLGIGKKLQQQLHNDLPNFSSAWYSPTNGIIKRKCGGHGVMDFPFAYYPVSSYFSIVLELIVKKLVSRKFSVPRLRLPYLYTKLNNLSGLRQKDYQIEELNADALPSLSEFMESCLDDTQFHIIRSKDYLQWKYVDNPRMKCHVLSVFEKGQRVGLIVFSDIQESKVVLAKAKIVKIYESLFTKTSKLSHKTLLAFVTNYYRNNKQPFDGILSLQKMDYRPTFIYPRPHSELLSTLPIEKLSSGYITYSDQDME